MCLASIDVARVAALSIIEIDAASVADADSKPPADGGQVKDPQQQLSSSPQSLKVSGASAR
jgi:hypothetical protein